MNDVEKVKLIRDKTMSPMNKISVALKRANGDVDKAIEILVQDKQADATDMANRVACASIVYSYVHNNKIGAMIVLACQTDFVAKNEVFLGLAKDICMHITSSPIKPYYVADTDIPKELLDLQKTKFADGTQNKPQAVADKIIMGKLNKYLNEVCLLRQNFVKNEEITVQQLIQSVSATMGEKIELKKFTKMTTN